MVVFLDDSNYDYHFLEDSLNVWEKTQTFSVTIEKELENDNKNTI